MGKELAKYSFSLSAEEYENRGSNFLPFLHGNEKREVEARRGEERRGSKDPPLQEFGTKTENSDRNMVYGSTISYFLSITILVYSEGHSNDEGDQGRDDSETLEAEGVSVQDDRGAGLWKSVENSKTRVRGATARPAS
jgi:hypothetical protein